MSQAAPPNRHALLDTAEEQCLDRILRIAQTTCNAACAGLSRIQNGRVLWTLQRGLRREELGGDPESFFSLAEMVSGPLVIRDREPAAGAQLSGRMPPGICFYAGVPLRSRTAGLNFGTLWVMDRSARESVPPDQLTILEDLAAVAVHWIDRQPPAVRTAPPETTLDARALYEAVLNSVNCAVISSGLDGLCRTWNRTAAEWFGYSQEEMIGKQSPLLLHDPGELSRRARQSGGMGIADENPAAALFSGALQPGFVHEGEWTYVRKDGATFPGLLTLTPLCGPHGEITGYVGIIRDRSEHQAAEAALRDSEARFQAFMAHVPANAYIKDADGRMMYINRACELLWETTLAEWYGKDDFDLWPAAVARKLRDNDIATLARGGVSSMVEEVPTPDGRVHQFLSFKFPFEDSRGQRFLGGFSVDISERQVMEDDLRKANEALAGQIRRVQHASQMKSNFLAGMSHELRTPLNSIIGFTELLQDGKPGPLNERQHRYVQNVLRSAQQLLQLINDLLDLAKVEAGRIDMRPEHVSASRILEEALSAFRPMAAERHIQLSAEADPAIEHLYLDPGRLKQIINNYLSNAIKFTPEGGAVSVRLAPEGPDRVRLEVSDTGIGIQHEDVRRLFQRFEQLEGGINRKYAGTGLGLALLKQLVELQGGTVGVNSIPGRGSVFHAVLPRIVHAPEREA